MNFFGMASIWLMYTEKMYKNIRNNHIKVVPFTEIVCYNKSGSAFMQKRLQSDKIRTVIVYRNLCKTHY